MHFDHVAIATPDIERSVAWYRETFEADIVYQDATWALLRVGGVRLALVRAGDHPPHIGVRVTSTELEAAAAESGQHVIAHRDGSRGVYLRDPAGNVVELVHYPGGDLHDGAL